MVNDSLGIARNFYVSDVKLRDFSKHFCQELQNAMMGAPSSLCRLDSCLALPTGNEKGIYLALDFGGTNIRISRVRLLGNGCYVIEKKISQPLRSKGKYDYASCTTTAVELFDFIAQCIARIVLPKEKYLLGHTFSFAVCQTCAADAAFVSWSKEIAVSGMEGKHINALLSEALLRQGVENVKPAALLNDTTAALLAAAYRNGNAQIAVICGTGFNICYYHPQQKTIFNLEAGNYSGAVQTEWDKMVAAASEQPERHLLEKMVGGRYLCEIFHRAVLTYFHADWLPMCTTKDMNDIIEENDKKQLRILLGRIFERIILPDDVEPIKNIAASLFIRAAQLTGASCSGVLQYVYPDRNIPQQTIAIEGSVMEHVKGSLVLVQDALRACLAVDAEGWTQPVPVEAQLVNDGPTIGAAIAAAICERSD